MATLYYIHDPMCSWCWGFSPTWQSVRSQLSPSVSTRLVLGGLAPDSSEPMPPQLQATLQSTWRQISEVVPGTQFNHAFWTDCKPRRSTYPACRAVSAARTLGEETEEKMVLGIQHAYYLNARNPSDDDVLISIAEAIGCEPSAFAALLNSAENVDQFKRDLLFCRELGVQGFPSLVFETNEGLRHAVRADYGNPQRILESINSLQAA